MVYYELPCWHLTFHFDVFMTGEYYWRWQSFQRHGMVHLL